MALFVELSITLHVKYKHITLDHGTTEDISSLKQHCSNILLSANHLTEF